jgi:hypothetical protein
MGLEFDPKTKGMTQPIITVAPLNLEVFRAT